MSPALADLPWKWRILGSIYSFIFGFVCRPDGSINRRLLNFIDVKTSPSPMKPVNGVKTKDITVDSTRNLWFRLYVPVTSTTTTDDNSMPVMFFFHGGGFFCMAANSKPVDEFCHRLAREVRAVIISVNYRLAPEHRYPSQYEDCFDVIKFVDNAKLEDLRCCANLKHSFLAGDSAGGNTAHHVAIKASEHDFKNVELIGIVSIQPFFGGEERTESETRLAGSPLVSVEHTDWMWRSFLPEGENRDHPASNVFGPNSADISEVRFPPVIIFVGGFDPLQYWQKRYYEGLKKHGKEALLVGYPNVIHGFYSDTQRPESSSLIKEVKGFMETKSGAK